MRSIVILSLMLLSACASRQGRAGRDGALGEGMASFYGQWHHGKVTANGERFNKNALTAAHRTARFGQCLRVVNLGNQRAVEVRVNDRGPYAHGRIIDLSEAAARELGMIEKGVARVRLYAC